MGTVGLTADLTPILSRGSHVILMILMYVGRIGPLTMALALSGRSDKISKFRELPEGKCDARRKWERQRNAWIIGKENAMQSMKMRIWTEK